MQDTTDLHLLISDGCQVIKAVILQNNLFKQFTSENTSKSGPY